MENKLGSYINNLMTTIVDKEEKWYISAFLFDEQSDASFFLATQLELFGSFFVLSF